MEEDGEKQERRELTRILWAQDPKMSVWGCRHQTPKGTLPIRHDTCMYHMGDCAMSTTFRLEISDASRAEHAKYVVTPKIGPTRRDLPQGDLSA